MSEYLHRIVLNPYRDKQQDPPVAECDQCGGKMYSEDVLYIWMGLHICGECMEQHFNCLTTAEKAGLLGCKMIRAGEQ